MYGGGFYKGIKIHEPSWIKEMKGVPQGPSNSSLSNNTLDRK